MKKILAMMMAVMMVVSMAACAKKTNDETTATPEVTTEATTEAPELAYKSAEELLVLLMDSYNATATDETKLYVCGGNINNFETTNTEGPAKFVALEDADFDTNLGYPTADVAKQDDAASMFNMMNVNVFNSYAVHFTDSADVDTMAEAIKENILNRQWICGSPEKLVIAKMPGDYLVVVWGAVEFGGIVDPFTASFADTVEGSAIVIEHSFAQ